MRVTYLTSGNHINILRLKKLETSIMECGRLKEYITHKSAEAIEPTHSLIPRAILGLLQEKFYLSTKVKLQSCKLPLI
jgi:hypothetical protein